MACGPEKSCGCPQCSGHAERDDPAVQALQWGLYAADSHSAISKFWGAATARQVYDEAIAVGVTDNPTVSDWVHLHADAASAASSETGASLAPDFRLDNRPWQVPTGSDGLIAVDQSQASNVTLYEIVPPFGGKPLDPADLQAWRDHFDWYRDWWENFCKKPENKCHPWCCFFQAVMGLPSNPCCDPKKPDRPRTRSGGVKGRWGTGYAVDPSPGWDPISTGPITQGGSINMIGTGRITQGGNINMIGIGAIMQGAGAGGVRGVLGAIAAPADGVAVGDEAQLHGGRHCCIREYGISVNPQSVKEYAREDEVGFGAMAKVGARFLFREGTVTYNGRYTFQCSCECCQVRQFVADNYREYIADEAGKRVGLREETGTLYLASRFGPPLEGVPLPKTFAGSSFEDVLIDQSELCAEIVDDKLEEYTPRLYVIPSFDGGVISARFWVEDVSLRTPKGEWKNVSEIDFGGLSDLFQTHTGVSDRDGLVQGCLTTFFDSPKFKLFHKKPTDERPWIEGTVVDWNVMLMWPVCGKTTDGCSGKVVANRAWGAVTFKSVAPIIHIDLGMVWKKTTPPDKPQAKETHSLERYEKSLVLDNYGRGW